MKRFGLVVVGLIAVFWFISALGGTISAETPVLVLAADDPVLRLPVSPSVDRIVGELTIELNRLAAEEPDGRIAAALQRLSVDDALLRGIATSPVEMFDGGEAAATATAVYDVTLDPDLVTVVITTVELVPSYGATAIARDHEDGHALINRRVAKTCGVAALTDSVNRGHQGSALIDGIISYLTAESDGVHALYHSYVETAGYGQHTQFAQQALADTSSCR